VAKDKDGVDGLNFDSSVNRQAYLEMRQAQESRAAEQKDTSPDTAAAMDKHFSNQDSERSDEVIMHNAYLRRDAERKSLSEMATLKGGGTQATGMTANEIVAAGGAKKGGYTSIESGPGGIVAAGGKKIGPTLGIGASADSQIAAAKWGASMQKIRTAEREYRRQQKKKNDGGLRAARQKHEGKNFFNHRPMFTVGAVTYSPMSFQGGFPQVGTHGACSEGWPQIVDGASNTLQRVTLQAGRNYRSSQPIYGP
jgi:hypothetical protein